MVKETLNRLMEIFSTGNIPRAERNWGGADVCIVRKAPPKKQGGFYPDPRYVATQYPRELSWLFEELRDAFFAEKLLDGCNKIEFFGRLANTALRAASADPEIPCPTLCRAVAAEAETMYNELTNGNFHYLTVASGNEIYDDSKKQEEGK